MSEKTATTQFDLTFSEALEALFEGYFIQGDDFGSGLYVKLDDTGAAVVFDAHNFSRRVTELVLSKGLARQNFRRFSVAHQAILT